MTNLVEITRFEALALFKHYRAKLENAKKDNIYSMVEEYKEKSEKWLEISYEIEQTNADGIFPPNKSIPDGFRDWAETHHEIVCEIQEMINNNTMPPKLYIIRDEKGLNGLYDLAIDLTIELRHLQKP